MEVAEAQREVDDHDSYGLWYGNHALAVARKQQERRTAMSLLATKTKTRMPFPARPTRPSKGMSRVIEKHRYWRNVASDFSPDNRTSTFLKSTGYYIARQLERSAMRRLVTLEPATCDEAKEKVLYLMAAVMAGPTKLCAAETTKVGKSVEPFKAELATFLRQR
jgi:hypothetical protein